MTPEKRVPTPQPQPKPKGSPYLPIDLGGSAAMLLVIAGVCAVGVMPLARLSGVQRERSAALALIDENNESLAGEIRSLEITLANTVAETEKNELTLMTAERLNERLASVVHQTESHGLRIVALKPGEPVVGEFHNHVPLRLGLTGPLPDFVRYLAALRHDSPDIVTRGLTVEAATDGAGVIALVEADWLTSAD